MWKSILCIVVCVGGIGLGVSSSDAVEEWFEYYQQAQECAKGEKWDAAIDLLEKAIALNPTPQTLKDLGWTKWGYYPYLELGKAYLGKLDSTYAAYYCAISKSRGFAPDLAVERCLANVEREQKFSRVLLDNFPAFPWPPPDASTDKVIPSDYLMSEKVSSLRDVAARLEKSLESAEYDEISYYHAPNGFVLVSRIEQINSNGTSKKLPERWALDMSPPSIFSLKSYLQALFTAQEGRFRIIAFVVTSELFGQDNIEITRKEAIAWMRQGAKVLPAEIGDLPYSAAHYCTALIYEFEQETRDHEPVFNEPSELTAREHLKAALLWKELVQSQ